MFRSFPHPTPQRATDLASARSSAAASADAEQSRLLGLVSAQAAALADKERQLEGLRLEMGAALAAGHADLEGREAAVREAERRLARQQVCVWGGVKGGR
jgi:hypothetical protein